MANYLKMPKKQQVIALLELGWSYRRIEAETGVRRETVSRYDRARRSNAANVFPGSESAPPARKRSGTGVLAWHGSIGWGDRASSVAGRPRSVPSRASA